MDTCVCKANTAPSNYKKENAEENNEGDWNSNTGSSKRQNGGWFHLHFKLN